MRFVETPFFTEAIVELVSDDEYSHLQAALLTRPDLGVVIPGSGGLRKVRWRAHGRGKHGGLRVIYFWQPNPDVLFMLYAYRKSEAGDLTASQLRALGRIVAEEFR